MLSIRERASRTQRTAPSIFSKTVYPLAQSGAPNAAPSSPRKAEPDDSSAVFTAPSPLTLTALRLDRTSCGLRDVCVNDMTAFSRIKVLLFGNNDLGKGTLVERERPDGHGFTSASASVLGPGLASIATSPGAAFWGLGALLPGLEELYVAGNALHCLPDWVRESRAAGANSACSSVSGSGVATAVNESGGGSRGGDVASDGGLFSRLRVLDVSFNSLEPRDLALLVRQGRLLGSDGCSLCQSLQQLDLTGNGLTALPEEIVRWFGVCGCRCRELLNVIEPTHTAYTHIHTHIHTAFPNLTIAGPTVAPRRPRPRLQRARLKGPHADRRGHQDAEPATGTYRA
jgi:Leucine-rich repeat (LRR) protein